MERGIGWVRPGSDGRAQKTTNDNRWENSAKPWEVWLFECLIFWVGVDEHGAANGAPLRVSRRCTVHACLDLQSRPHPPYETLRARH